MPATYQTTREPSEKGVVFLSGVPTDPGTSFFVMGSRTIRLEEAWSSLTSTSLLTSSLHLSHHVIPLLRDSDEILQVLFEKRYSCVKDATLLSSVIDLLFL